MTSRDRRALALGGGLIVLSWLGLRGLPTVVAALEDSRESVAQRTQLLARAQGRLSRVGRLDDSIAVLETAARALPDRLLGGEDAETASVDLMRRMRETLSAYGSFVSVSGFGSHGVIEERPPLRLAYLDVAIESDFMGILEVTHELEGDSTLGLESISISGADEHAAAGLDERTTNKTAERLTATIRVSGWFRTDSGGEEPASPLGTRER
jgi:hypothetical protein